MDERTLFEYERDMYSPIAQRQMEEYALEEEKAKNTRSTFRTFLDNFSGNLQRESDRKLSENKALTEYLQTPEGQRASTAVGLGVASLLPIPGAKTRFANQMANIMRPPLTQLGARVSTLPTSQSGLGVGTDVLNKVFIPPLTKIGQRTTKRGPRGPINIETPVVRPKAPPPGTRNTAGVSETDQAMIKMQQSQQGIMNTPAALKGLPPSLKSSRPKPLKSREEIRQDKKLQQLQDEQTQLRAYANMVNSMRQQGEATQDQMRNLERVTARLNFLNKILK